MGQKSVGNHWYPVGHCSIIKGAVCAIKRRPIQISFEVPLPTTVTEFSKAVGQLERALNQPKDEFIRDSVIQRFEFCIELAWKTSMKIMGTVTTAPKDVIREMASAGYIANAELWLKSIDMRNLSSHTYKEDLAEVVYGFAKTFYPELVKLVSVLQKKQS